MCALLRAYTVIHRRRSIFSSLRYSKRGRRLVVRDSSPSTLSNTKDDYFENIVSFRVQLARVNANLYYPRRWKNDRWLIRGLRELGSRYESLLFRRCVARLVLFATFLSPFVSHKPRTMIAVGRFRWNRSVERVLRGRNK